MKKFLVIALVAMSTSAFAQVSTYTTLGPFINCHVVNQTPTWITVNLVDYDIMTVGGLKDHTQPCSYNCAIAPYTQQQFNGPRNSHLVHSAQCSVRFNY